VVWWRARGRFFEAALVCSSRLEEDLDILYVERLGYRCGEIRSAARHSRYADPEGGGAWADSRVWNRSAHSTDFERRFAGAAGLALSGLAPARESRLAHGEMGPERKRARSEILFLDEAREK